MILKYFTIMPSFNFDLWPRESKNQGHLLFKMHQYTKFDVC
jgi:hypothetical protein